MMEFESGFPEKNQSQAFAGKEHAYRRILKTTNDGDSTLSGVVVDRTSFTNPCIWRVRHT
jgi:hypothetical protein